MGLSLVWITFYYLCNKIVALITSVRNTCTQYLYTCNRAAELPGVEWMPLTATYNMLTPFGVSDTPISSGAPLLTIL